MFERQHPVRAHARVARNTLRILPIYQVHINDDFAARAKYTESGQPENWHFGTGTKFYRVCAGSCTGPGRLSWFTLKWEVFSGRLKS